MPSELLEPYFETSFICDDYPDSPLQFERASQDWRNIFNTQNIISIGVITAYNPFSQLDNHLDNVNSQKRLYQMLIDDGYTVLNGMGMSKDEQWQEPSFFVINIEKIQLEKYLVTFKQTGGVYMDSSTIPILILHPTV